MTKLVSVVGSIEEVDTEMCSGVVISFTSDLCNRQLQIVTLIINGS